MKKISIVLLSVAMLFAFTACNPAGPSTEDAEGIVADYIDALSAQNSLAVLTNGYGCIKAAIDETTGAFDTTTTDGKLSLTGNVAFVESSAVVSSATVNIALADTTHFYNDIFHTGKDYAWTEGTVTVNYTKGATDAENKLTVSTDGIKIDNVYTLAFTVTVPESYFGDLSQAPTLPSPDYEGLEVTIRLNGTSVDYAKVYDLTENVGN